MGLSYKKMASGGHKQGDKQLSSFPKTHPSPQGKSIDVETGMRSEQLEIKIHSPSSER
jgi:hypothetical protein